MEWLWLCACRAGSRLQSLEVYRWPIRRRMRLVQEEFANHDQIVNGVATAGFGMVMLENLFEIREILRLGVSY